MWLYVLLIIVLVLAASLAVTAAYGSRRWEAGTQAVRQRLDAGRRPLQPPRVDFQELTALPEPVQRYFRTVLRDGQPMVTGVRLQHRGTFNMGETADRWKSFSSDQHVVTQRPGFDWNGRIRMLPGVPVRVHDAYVAGEGILHAALFGLFSLVNLRGTGALAEGELLRFFAEAAWYPTALLPSQGVRWEPVEARSAHGTLTADALRLRLRFTFNEQDLIESVRADARGRTVGGQVIPTPWRGRFWNYAERGGMLVPLDGEVAWLLPEGEKPYWRGSITDIVYELAR